MPKLFQRWVDLWQSKSIAPPSDSGKTPLCIDDGAAIPLAASHGALGDTQMPSKIGEKAVPKLHDIDIGSLRKQRMELDNAQRDALIDLEALESDRRGLVARYAETRLSGTPVALRAIERQYKSMQSRIRHLEKRHHHLNRLLQLLQEAEEIKENAQWRESQVTGGLLSIDMPHLTALIEQAVADDLLESKRIDDLLDALDDVGDLAAASRAGASSAARQELMELTETDVQRASSAQLVPLEQAADLFDQSMVSQRTATITQPEDAR